MRPATYDVAIIGGGIVGLSTARELVRGPRPLRVAVLEAEPELASHQTGHNSGVIHAGLYYRPGSLKAKSCVEGRDALYQYCSDRGIAHRRCGKVIVATRESELAALADLERRAGENGVGAVRRLTAEGIRELEPHAAGIAGLHVEATGIVDFREVAASFAAEVVERDGEILTGARFLGKARSSGEVILETSRGVIPARFLVNCAGLQSDRVARLCGIEPGLRIVPFRGEYYELVAARSNLVRGLIYPVPDPRLPFLGVHFTRRIDGRVEAGPNAVLALSREGYRWTSVSARDLADLVSWKGYWKMTARYWKTGLLELDRSLRRRAFVGALRTLVPEIGEGDVRRGGAGVRAQAVDANGTLLDDFRMIEAERMLHVLNAPSPAATASISIGRRIASVAERSFGLG